MLPLWLIVAFMAIVVHDSVGALDPGRPAGVSWAGLAHAWEAPALLLGAFASTGGIVHAVVSGCTRAMDRSGKRRLAVAADRAVRLGRLVGVGLFVIGVLALGWLDAVREVVGDLVLADELVALAPLVFLVVWGWVAWYPMERKLREAGMLRAIDEGRAIAPLPGRWAYALEHARTGLGVVGVPLVAIVGFSELIDAANAIGWLPGGADGALGLGPGGVVALIKGVGALTIFMAAPLAARYVLPTTSLRKDAGPAPLREALDAMCRDCGVRVRDILVWRTGGLMINGAVMGLVRQARYVLLTDALLDELSEGEVKAVMAHELAHVRLGHMIWLVLCLGSTMLVATVAVDQALRQTAIDGWLVERLGVTGVEILITGAGLGVALVVFGYVSRRFEWQADAFAARRMSQDPEAIDGAGAALMAGALQRVAELNAAPIDRWTWRHGSILDRIQRLGALVGQRKDRLRIDRSVAVLKGVTLATLVAAIGLIAWSPGP